MLIETQITCPQCGEPTAVTASVPEPGTGVDQQASVSSCTACATQLLLVSQADGQLLVSELAAATDGGECVPIAVEHPFALDQLVDVPAAIVRPRGIAVDEFAIRPEWADALGHELALAQQRPRPLSVPRRIFISYRWGTAQADAWVARLHAELVARGNAVVFDRELERAEQPPSVPALVAEIASCHMFLAVLDPGYLERVTGTDDTGPVEGWVTDEFHTAMGFAAAGIVLPVGLLRSGGALPSPFVPFTHDSPGNTFDVRADGALDLVLDPYFQQAAPAPAADVASTAGYELMGSARALVDGDLDAALQAADRACTLIPDLPDAFAQRARVERRRAVPEPALRDATRALDIDPTLADVRLIAAEAAAASDRWQLAAEHARRLVEADRTDGAAHTVLGRALDAVGCVDVALAHFEHAHRSGVRSHVLFHAAGIAALRNADPDLALVWFRAGLAEHESSATLHLHATLAAIQGGHPVAAYEHLERFDERCPGDGQVGDVRQLLVDWCSSDSAPPQFLEPVPTGVVVARFECDGCGARIGMPTSTSVLCAGCGVVCASVSGPCTHCGAAGRALPHLGGACPVCHGHPTRVVALEDVAAP